MTDRYVKGTIRTICAILAGFILFGLVGTMDVQEEERQLDHYCEMVKLHKQNPSIGWPDYETLVSRLRSLVCIEDEDQP